MERLASEDEIQNIGIFLFQPTQTSNIQLIVNSQISLPKNRKLPTDE